MITIKTCSICNEDKELTDFYTNGKAPSGKVKYKPHCKSCQNRKTKVDAWKKIKKVLNAPLACVRCGYSRNLAALDFHHIDPNEKRAFNI